MNSNQQGWRVKLYQLNDQGQWDDRGTGHISCTFVEELGNALVILNEENQQELLKSKIIDEDVYQRQGDNIITWTEPEENGSGVDLALSFQENAGCLEIWNKVCDVQGKYSEFRPDESKYSLPECKMDSLSEIGEALAGASQQQQKEVYVNLLLAKDGEYLNKLLQIFDDCEDLDDLENLHVLVNIFKAIFSLNDPTLLEVILSDQFFVRVAGVFEYDPELKHKGDHRTFLQEKVQFKQVLPIEDPELGAKIRQNFRISFLRDVLLRPMMDDAYASTLSSLAFFNNSEILQALHQDSDYLKRLYALFLAKGTSRQTRADILAFTREMVGMSKTLQPSVRDQFYRYLQSECLFFDVFVTVLADEEATIPARLCCMEVLVASLFHDPSLLRNYILQKGGHPPLPTNFGSASQAGRKDEAKGGGAGAAAAAGGAGGLGDGGPGAGAGGGGGAAAAADPPGQRGLLYWVIHRLTTDTDAGVLLQAADVVRECLNCETMEGPDRDAFLTAFYDHYVHWLAAPFWALGADDGGGGGGGKEAGDGLKLVDYEEDSDDEGRPAAAARPSRRGWRWGTRRTCWPSACGSTRTA